MHTLFAKRLGSVVPITFATLLVTAAVGAQIPCGYDVTIIQAPETPPFGFPPTLGFGINESGDVCGYWSVLGPDEHAFVWTAETGLITLDPPPGVSSAIASDIEDGGPVVGRMIVTDLGDRAFLYDRGRFFDLGVLPEAVWSGANFIGNGQIVGGASHPVTGFTHAVVWEEDGVMFDLGASLPAPRSSALEVSEAGIVGWMGTSPDSDASAFLWADCEVSDLGMVPGGYTGIGTSINNLGQITIAGKLVNPEGGLWLKKGFLWHQGRWTDLGALPGYDRTNPSSMNDGTVIVGTCGKASNPNDARPFIWCNGVMRDLNDLIDPDTSIYLSGARAINEAGQITGRAIFNVDVVAYLLTPIAPPLGDVNADCHVDVSDLLILLANWGPCDDCAKCPADFNGDCAVGVFDLLVLLSNWG